jgi:putative oxidoreductase
VGGDDVLNTILWIVQILTAGMFLFAGGFTLAGAAAAVAAFDQIGFGQGFRYATGGLEVIGAILLLIPRTAALGAALLAVIMVGAIATHLFFIGGSPAPAIVFLLVTSFLAWQRRPAAARAS